MKKEKSQPKKHLELHEGGTALYLGGYEAHLPLNKILTVREIEPTRVHCTWPSRDNEKLAGEGWFMQHNLKAIS